METQARIRINLSQGELEVEGSESFVERWADPLRTMLARLLEGGSSAPAASPAALPRNLTETSPFGSFGEFIHHLPSDATEVDRMLAAGFWCQQNNPDRTFTTAEASRRLAEHGFRIGNPSQCVRQSIMAKRVFMVQKGRYRVSHHGKHYLRQLMGEVVPLEDATPA
jgi:hypothetical protein